MVDIIYSNPSYELPVTRGDAAEIMGNCARIHHPQRGNLSETDGR